MKESSIEGKENGQRIAKFFSKVAQKFFMVEDRRIGRKEN
jgi:hypothetical protein